MVTWISRRVSGVSFACTEGVASAGAALACTFSPPPPNSDIAMKYSTTAPIAARMKTYCGFKRIKFVSPVCVACG